MGEDVAQREGLSGEPMKWVLAIGRIGVDYPGRPRRQCWICQKCQYATYTRPPGMREHLCTGTLKEIHLRCVRIGLHRLARPTGAPPNGRGGTDRSDEAA